MNANTFVETDRQKGKVVEVDHWTVSPDGKAMKLEWERKDSGRKGSSTYAKQSPTSWCARISCNRTEGAEESSVSRTVSDI